jgi:hypothetical protein
MSRIHAAELVGVEQTRHAAEDLDGAAVPTLPLPQLWTDADRPQTTNPISAQIQAVQTPTGPRTRALPQPAQ